MYIVIFKATIRQLDPQYSIMAQNLRQKAFAEYHCQKFESYTENQQEIALSYWLSLEDIQAWKNDPEHLLAQQLGHEKWYSTCSVEICQSLK
ncbi:hypothetical protein GCM10023206_00140 [Acinetobacter puyangensis]|uniref:Antibiotic biosynthesis monooxygenase n=1 Tax=Acinetobacter puyangensis TaxID=1096779 RepID=A0A240E7T7_9GAMM|nr:antibiotic biosynthesis monooxygenase [Acinetobacter puyangensis]SNX44636.1 hypothetical protein SAMN05421731_103378 [Acinetobacter puyangensis]